jgi:photosystem II stability/assembly factor-like uncharacterized protein
MSSEILSSSNPYVARCAILPLVLLFVPLAAPLSNSVWTNKGPDGGEIWCIAVDPLAPGTLYAGTNGAGIFKSTDKGETWTATNGGLTDFSIMAIAVDPRDSRTLYSSTMNVGIFKSTDGGQTWARALSAFPDFSVVTLAIDPINAGTVYAGTTGAGVFKSTDGGYNWTAVNVGLSGKDTSFGESIAALAIDRRNPMTVYAGTYFDGVFKTINGGQTWTPVNRGLPFLSLNTLAIDPQNANVLYAGIYEGGFSRIWKTVDGGGNWNLVTGIGLPQFNVLASLVADPNKRETIYVVGYLSSGSMATGIFSSTDGGQSWTVLSDVPDSQIPPLAIDAHDSSTIYAGSTNSGMYKSTDGGNTWIHSSRGISAVDVHGITVDRSNPRTVYASTSQGVFKSTDGGGTWMLKFSDPRDYPVVIDPSNPATIYVPGGGVLKSTDGGDSWRYLVGGGSVVALAIDPNKPETLYAGEVNYPFGPPVTGNGVDRTDDGGETWRPANGGLPTSGIAFGFLAVDPKNSATVYAATFWNSWWPSGRVYRTTDGGTTWELINDEPPITAMALDTQKAGLIYAGTAGKGLLRTVDGGDTWVSLDNVLKDRSITALAVSDTGTVLYAGAADGGIFRSADDGITWAQLNIGLTMPGIQSLAVDPQNAETVYAGTPGGIFKLTTLNSALDVDVPTGGAAVASTEGSERTIRTGYATLTIDSGSIPSGVAVLTFNQNCVTTTEAGVPPSPPTTRARLFIDYRSGAPGVAGASEAGTVDIDTGVAVVNPGSATARVTYTLRDNAGTTISMGHGMVAAGGHFAKFVDQLKDVASDFNLPPDFQFSTGFGSLEISSDQRLSILALRQIINQRDEALLTTTPTADLSQPLRSTPIYFPQFVDGGGYMTTLVLLNTSARLETGTIRILDDSGGALAINQVGGTADSAFRYAIPAGGVFRFQTDGFPAAVKVGWVELTPDAGSPTPVGAGILSLNSGNVLVAECGVPAAAATNHARVYIDLSDGHNMGVAIANPAGTDASIAMKAFQSDGVTGIGTRQDPLRLAGNGHSAKFASEIIAGLPAGFTGVLDITSAVPFAALTLRSLLNERHDFLMTTFPIADQAIPPPVVFPQIADGGGFITQVILVSSGSGSKTTLGFFDDDGNPLPAGK